MKLFIVMWVVMWTDWQTTEAQRWNRGYASDARVRHHHHHHVHHNEISVTEAAGSRSSSAAAALPNSHQPEPAVFFDDLSDARYDSSSFLVGDDNWHTGYQREEQIDDGWSHPFPVGVGSGFGRKSAAGAPRFRFGTDTDAAFGATRLSAAGGSAFGRSSGDRRRKQPDERRNRKSTNDDAEGPVSATKKSCRPRTCGDAARRSSAVTVTQSEANIDADVNPEVVQQKTPSNGRRKQPVSSRRKQALPSVESFSSDGVGVGGESASRTPGAAKKRAHSRNSRGGGQTELNLKTQNSAVRCLSPCLITVRL